MISMNWKEILHAINLMHDSQEQTILSKNIWRSKTKNRKAKKEKKRKKKKMSLYGHVHMFVCVSGFRG